MNEDIQGYKIKLLETTTDSGGRYFDIFINGEHANAGEPWFDDGQGPPTREELEQLVLARNRK